MPQESALFIFKQGRTNRLAVGGFPTEFFYGALELQKAGKPVEWIEEDDLLAGARTWTRFWRFLLRPLPRLLRSFPVPLWNALLYARRPILQALNEHAVVVVTTQTLGMCLGLLRGLGLLRARVVFVVMGALPLGMRGMRRRILIWCLSQCEPVCISQEELGYLKDQLPNIGLRYVPFGVDAKFWAPGAGVASSPPYVLSIGNDGHRDFKALVESWQPHFPLLRVVTRLSVECAKPNVEIVKGDWRSQILSDEQIRTLFQDSLFVIIPVRETIQPSGQSACLQAMACGKAVVMSNIKGLWDRTLMRSGESCLLVAPGEIGELTSAAERLLGNSGLCWSLGEQARHVITDHLNADAMADAMGKVLFHD